MVSYICIQHKGSCVPLPTRNLRLSLCEFTVWLYSGGIVFKMNGCKHVYFLALHIIMLPIAGWVSWETDPEMGFSRPVVFLGLSCCHFTSLSAQLCFLPLHQIYISFFKNCPTKILFFWSRILWRMGGMPSWTTIYWYNFLDFPQPFNFFGM